MQRGEPKALDSLLRACKQQGTIEAVDVLVRSSRLPQRRKDACKKAAGTLRLYNHLHVIMKVFIAAS